MLFRSTSGRLSAITGRSERLLGYQYLLTETDLPRIRFRVFGFEGSGSVPGPAEGQSLLPRTWHARFLLTVLTVLTIDMGRGALERGSFLLALINVLTLLMAMALDASPGCFLFWGLLIATATTDQESNSEFHPVSSLSSTTWSIFFWARAWDVARPAGPAPITATRVVIGGILMC